MKLKRIIILIIFTSIISGVSACSTPAYAFDEALVIENARIDGEKLHIEVTDNTAKAKSILEFDLRDYSENTEYITIQAVDPSGNKSEAVRVKNPKYKPVESVEISGKIEENPTGYQIDNGPSDGAFTPDGAGTVMDDVLSNSKEFFTITTDSKNTFYLIIDRQRNSENVYLLNAVTEQDLLDFIRKNSKNDVSEVTTMEAITKPPQTSETIAETMETPHKTEKNRNNTGTIIFILIAVIGVGGAGWYFKIYKPKQSIKSDEIDEIPSESDDFEGGDESD